MILVKTNLAAGFRSLLSSSVGVRQQNFFFRAVFASSLYKIFGQLATVLFNIVGLIYEFLDFEQKKNERANRFR